MEETLGSTNTSKKQKWIAEQARKHPERVFTSLHHLIDMDWMLEAYRRTRKDGAAGIDGVTAADYADGTKRPLGIPTTTGRRSPAGRFFCTGLAARPTTPVRHD